MSTHLQCLACSVSPICSDEYCTLASSGTLDPNLHGFLGFFKCLAAFDCEAGLSYHLATLQSHEGMSVHVLRNDGRLRAKPTTCTCRLLDKDRDTRTRTLGNLSEPCVSSALLVCAKA